MAIKKTLISSLLFVTITAGNFARAAEPVTLKDIAGDYYLGDGLGLNWSMTVAAEGQFKFEWRGCMGVYATNEGSAAVKEGILHISPQKPTRSDGFPGTPTDFFPVRWGERIYLIATNHMVEFCSDFNQGKEPRRGDHGNYYLRRKDGDKPVSGKPDVPEPWTKYFLDKPVRGTITELVGKQEAWLDKGSSEGLLAGMVLTAQQHGKLLFSQVQIEEVEQGRCRIKCRWNDSELVVGQIVTSRFSDHQP